MTGTEQHAPRGTAGRGPNWDRGPGAGRAGAARRCTTRHRRPWAQLGPSAVDGPRRLRVDACASRYRRPRDHSWDRGSYAGQRTCSTRSGKLRCRPLATCSTLPLSPLSSCLRFPSPRVAADAAHSSSRARRMPSAVLCAVNAVPPRPAYAARGAAAILRDCFGRYPLSRSPSSFIA